MASLLADTAHMTLQDIDDRLSHASFRIRNVSDGKPGNLSIHAMNLGSRDPAFVQHKSTSASNFVSWSPIIMKLIGLVLLFSIPITIIATLIALLLKSEANHGLIDLPSDKSMIHYGWTLIPAAIFAGVAAVFAALDKSVLLLYPYHVLRYGHSTQGSELEPKDYTRAFALQRAWYAIRDRHLSLAVSSSLCAIIDSCGQRFIRVCHQYVEFLASIIS